MNMKQIIERSLTELVNHQANRRSSTGSAAADSAAADPARSDNDPEAGVVIGTVLPSRRDQILRSRGGGGTEPASPVLVALTTAERRTHVYALGSTGSGKSVFAANLIDHDTGGSSGVMVLDARGDLVDRQLNRLAARFPAADLAERLVVLDLRQHAPYALPGQPARVVGFNPLAEAGADGYASAFFCYDALDGLNGNRLGVQTGEILRNALLALALTNSASTDGNDGDGGPGALTDLEALLSHPPFRERVLATVPDAGVVRFFRDRYPRLEEQGQYGSAVLNKVAPLLSLPVVRRMLSMRRGGISFRRLFEARPDAIVLCSLGADEIGQGAGLIGSLLISAVARAVMRADRLLSAAGSGAGSGVRSGSGGGPRSGVFLYLDEFENFAAAAPTIEEIISEGRRFGLALTALHQSTAQLEPRMRALLRNIVGNQLFFAVGGLDADTLSGEIPSDEPKATLRQVLLSQAVGEAMLLRRGQMATRIRVRYTPDPNVSVGRIAALRQASIERWGLPQDAVEAELARREQEWESGSVEPSEAGPTASPVASSTSSTSPTSPAPASVRYAAPFAKRSAESARSSRSAGARKASSAPVAEIEPTAPRYEVRELDSDAIEVTDAIDNSIAPTLPEAKATKAHGSAGRSGKSKKNRSTS